MLLSCRVFGYSTIVVVQTSLVAGHPPVAQRLHPRAQQLVDLLVASSAYAYIYIPRNHRVYRYPSFRYSCSFTAVSAGSTAAVQDITATEYPRTTAVGTNKRYHRRVFPPDFFGVCIEVVKRHSATGWETLRRAMSRKLSVAYLENLNERNPQDEIHEEIRWKLPKLRKQRLYSDDIGSKPILTALHLLSQHHMYALALSQPSSGE